MGPDTLQLGEDLGEEAGLGVDPQHGSAELVDDCDTSVPELLLVGFHEEGFEWIAAK